MRLSVFRSVVISLIISAVTFSSCTKEPVQNNNNGIATIKNPNWQDNIGEEFTLEGYLSLQPEGVLHYDLDDRLQNKAIDEDRYIRVNFNSDELAELSDDYHGAKVKITGVVARDRDPASLQVAQLLGTEYQAVLDVSSTPQLVEASTLEPHSFFDICEANPAFCDGALIDPNPETFVLLFSGGINASAAYGRYWNDMVFFYTVMAWFYGIPAENMIIVYKDGVPENGYMPVDYPATVAGVEDAFDYLAEEMDGNDTFIFFATNHGGTGYADSNGDELSSGPSDEALFYYDQPGRISDDLLADYVDGLKFGRMLGIYEPCFAGGLMYDLRGENRVQVSASKEDQVSWGGLVNYGNEYDHFVFHFTSALAGQKADGTPVDADTDNNGKVSVAEAFDYARIADTADEIPQIDSDGNGIPSATSSGETFGNADVFFLK